MSELLVVGASYKTVPLDLRERIVVADSKIESFLESLMADGSIVEAVVLSTCNRTELYLVGSASAETSAVGQLASQSSRDQEEIAAGIYSHRNCDAAKHLFRVISSLESMVIGESEIQGQVKRAYETALRLGTTGPLTNRLFRAAIETGKRVRNETLIGTSGTSVASVAVDLARELITDLSGRRVLIIGSGEVAEMTARSLSERGVHPLFVANRRRERALSLARRFGGSTITLDDLPSELELCDIVISSTSSPHTIIGTDELELVMKRREFRPLLMIDLAVPRDIEHACVEINGVNLFDIDDLEEQVQRSRQTRQAEAIKAQEIIEDELRTFANWLGSQEVTPTISALRAYADAIVDSILMENETKWERFSEKDIQRVHAIVRATVNRLLHTPTQRIRELEPENRHARLQLIRELFDIDEDSLNAMPDDEIAALRSSDSRVSTRPVLSLIK